MTRRIILKLFPYVYATEVTFSRKIERRYHVDIAFRWLSVNTTPSLTRFHRRHESVLENLFNQVPVLCTRVGPVKLGKVTLNGTKIRA